MTDFPPDQEIELAVHEWRDGLIAEVWSVTDRLEVQQQLTDDPAG